MALLTSQNGDCCGVGVVFVASDHDSITAVCFFLIFHFLSSFHSFQVDVGNQIFVLVCYHILMNVKMIPDDEFCFGLQSHFFLN